MSPDGAGLGRGTGPLRGVRVVEIAGIGPGPHAATLLADLGADVVRVERPGGALSAGPRETDLLTRGRPSVALDLKHPRAVETVLTLAARADVLLEGMRPGAAERLGIGPDVALARNPRLVYGRMTGWGQDGPLAQAAGHDLNYIGLAGALHGLGQTADRPQFPSNLLGDFGGGSTYLVVGVLAALLEARSSGAGQVVDAAIVDGTAHLTAMFASLLAGGAAHEARASGLLDGGAPFYDLYETADGRHMSVGALEPQFFAELVRLLELEDAPGRLEVDRWPELRERLAARFRERTQAEWTEVFDGTDACVAPVLPLTEAAAHPHLAARGTYVDRDGLLQPAPAPRFSRTEATLGTGPSVPGGQTRAALTAWGVPDVDGLIESGAAVQA
ncbi:MAG TPA: CaiB/BaiF CoA-transferase family protein [Nocardioides sp.]|uniref:CaiB/BaiF CoA transferase family protein n=1 Tax=Nocardioides sp. TaxID=35761 RepID=UPI002D8045C3|nr:CaiB/BaiF CoA-transferase family protein [Nocardioides sp.]HET6653114.1 CaiB/BaiF CoA-transferase family protein [Nocardioides sp.]